ncbi:MAG: ABC-F family ATP-binding cassette domain-containing protein [Alphaproteobacteria bacterium]
MLQIDNLTYRIAGRMLFDRASARVPGGHKVGIVGRNGTGKSTLLALISGELQPDDGEIELRRGARMGQVAQEAPAGPTSLIDTVLAADTERAALLVESETASDPVRIAEIHTRLTDIRADSAPARAATILAGLGFDELAQQRPCSDFSGGWRMRVALAAMLFSEPDLLLLDEPTNYLDLEGTLWLENYLRTYPHTVLLVSHDRDLLNTVVDQILLLHDLKLTLYRGGYDQMERTRNEQLALQQKAAEKQAVQRKHMQAFVDRFRYKASKARQAQSRLKALAKMEPIAEVMTDPSVELAFPEPDELAPPLLTLEDCSVGYETGKPILRRLNLRIDDDDRIALIGRNGNGKTTLAKLFAGELDAMNGQRAANRKLQIGYFGQHQIEQLDPEADAVTHLRRLLPNLQDAALRARLGGFGLQQDKAVTPAKALSGGEKARLVLALISARKPQLLLLDEPTNHLDVDARQALVQALNDYRGAVVVISHDRHLIELVADRLWLVADGTVTAYEGDVDDYRRQLIGGGGGRARDVRPAAAPPPPPVDKKQARKEAAAKRADQAPMRRRLQKLEQELARLTAEHKAVAAKLAAPETYEGEAATKVPELTQQRAELERRIAEVEHDWLSLGEELEAAE